MLDQRYSDNDVSRRDIPSFIEPRPPLIQNPFMRPRPQKGTNLLELFEDSEFEEPELVQVYLRLKPCSVPNTLYEVRSERCLVTSLDTATAGHGRRTQHNVSKMYTFSKIFGSECNQKEIFEQVVKENLKKLPEGHNFTLLTYGASGSGKTYTLMGTVGAPGLVPRSLEYVFRLVDAAQRPAYKPAENGAEKLSNPEQDFELQWVKRLRHVSAPLRDKYRRMSVQLHSDLTISSIDLSNRVRHYVWVSFVEIYNEAIYDLLAPPDKRAKLRIREDSSGNVYVKGATQAFVRSGEEAYDVMVAGKHNLVVAATGVHAHSSRSHCIFTITMLTESGEAGAVRSSSVRLCDLAGCERARATRNTGARMQESRAINSSLHVLERCLHMLRRKQRTGNDALVPYRESKLTRLLGTGLSGARGEAVSMVVTLNPSPEYAHETKHVLSLAAVAQDIQINNTILGSTLESTTTQDTTINCSNEVMKLRSDNERLHFELVQSQARNKELMAAMEERQQEAAITMRELVEEAKDMTRQYYEAQLEALRSEMDDMVEEYECRLSKQTKERAPSSGAGTPSRYLQTKVAQLMTEIAVLEEQITAERLARARAEKEVQYLRTCIEERDEKAFKDITPPPQDLILSDSEHETDDEDDISDPFNESLEPVFKKEINKSVAKQNDTVSVHTIDNIDEEDDGENNDDISRDTIKCNESENSVNIGDQENTNISVKDNTIVDDDDENDITEKNKTANDVSKRDESVVATNVTYESSGIDSANSSYNNEISTVKKYDGVVKDDTMDLTHDKTDDRKENNDFNNESAKSNFVCRGTYFVSDSKLDDKDKNENFKETSISSLRATYFIDAPAPETIEFKNDTVEVFKEPVIEKPPKKVAEKVSDTLVSKIIRSFKSAHGSDSSLRQFEQLEIASKECHDDAAQNQSIFGDIKMLKEKRTYFDNEPTKKADGLTDTAHLVVNKEKRTYFDNIDVNVEVSSKRINEIKKIDEERSPSIVKENIISDNFEPSKIKKLLGESFTKPEIVTSVQKNRLAKKHASVDLFESPVVKPTEKIDNVELARQSIEKLVLEQQSAKKGNNRDVEPKSALKVENTTSPKKTVAPISPMKQYQYNNKAQSPTKKDTLELPIKQDSIQFLIEKAAIQSSAKKNTFLSSLQKDVPSTTKQDIVQSSNKKDTVRSPRKRDIEKILDPIEIELQKDAVQSIIKQDIVQSSTKKDTVPSPKKRDTENILAPIEIGLQKYDVQSITKQDIVQTSKKDTVQSQKKREMDKILTPIEINLQKDVPSVTKQDIIQSSKKDTVQSQKKKSTEKILAHIDIKKEIKLEPMSSLEDMVTAADTKKDAKLEPASSRDEPNRTELTNDTTKDNTIEEFENIYKDITAPRATEFELLVSQSINESSEKSEKEETKYNLRKKHSKTDDNKTDKSKVEISDEVLLESQAKCESKARKRPLRLRRRKNQGDDDSEDKLKDIVNLQSEFSDVTMDVPAPHKVVKDIPSPEKGAEENLPPIMGIQSCPAKSIVRSRRKLFTPRAEPLEESLSQTGDSNERIYVPRPSYHRPRARRKL